MQKILWAALMVAGLVLAGCGGSNNTSDKSDEGMDPPPPPVTPAGTGNCDTGTKWNATT